MSNQLSVAADQATMQFGTKTNMHLEPWTMTKINSATLNSEQNSNSEDWCIIVIQFHLMSLDPFYKLGDLK